jgi:Septum formation
MIEGRMVAPPGVNEGLPQESANAGQALAELTEAPTAEAVPDRELTDDGELTDTAPAEADLREAGLAATGRAEAEPAAAEPLDAGTAEAEPTDTGTAETDPAAAEAEPAEAGLGEAGPAEAGLGEEGEPGRDAGERSRDVSPLAVIGIILGVVALVGVAVGVLAVLTHGFRPKTVVTYRPAAVFGLRPGQCVNSGANALAVTVLSCAQPHDAEVFASFSLPATAWPGDSAVQQDAHNACASRLGGYLNPQLATADVTQEYVYPNQAAWRAGERTVVCEVRAVDGQQLIGSVRAVG